MAFFFLVVGELRPVIARYMTDNNQLESALAGPCVTAGGQDTY
jgi:hypothetical protein